MAKHTLSDAEILAQIPAANARTKTARQAGHRAMSVRYDRTTKRIMMELSNGCMFGFPVTAVSALNAMSSTQLSQVVLSPAGSGLIWEAEDVDLSVPGLLLSSIGTQEGMRVPAQKGGRTKSPAKAEAARANGAKGGRPRKRKAA